MTETAIPGPAWIPAFLETLTRTKAVGLAARATGVTSGSIYAQRKRNSLFADAWLRALSDPSGEDGASTALPTGGWKKNFLESLAETSNVKESAGRTNTPISTVYAARRNDAAFARQWQEALFEGYTNLEMEVLGFLRSTDPSHKMDVANALRLLAIHREAVAKEKARRGKEDEAEVLADLKARFDAMRERREAAMKLLDVAPGISKDGNVPG